MSKYIKLSVLKGLKNVSMEIRQKELLHLQFEVLTTAMMKIPVFRDMTPYL
jgi:hypothetical protein